MLCVERNKQAIRARGIDLTKFYIRCSKYRHRLAVSTLCVTTDYDVALLPSYGWLMSDAGADACAEHREMWKCGAESDGGICERTHRTPRLTNRNDQQRPSKVDI